MSDKEGCHTEPSRHGDKGLQGDEDKGVENIPGTDAIIHTASMMFNRLNISTDSTEQMVANKSIRCINVFSSLCSNKKSVCSSLSTTAWQQDGAALVQMGLSPWLLPMCYRHLTAVHMLFPNFCRNLMCHSHKYDVVHTSCTRHVPGYENAVANRDNHVTMLDCINIVNNDIVWFAFKR